MKHRDEDIAPRPIHVRSLGKEVEALLQASVPEVLESESQDSLPSAMIQGTRGEGSRVSQTGSSPLLKPLRLVNRNETAAIPVLETVEPGELLSQDDLPAVPSSHWQTLLPTDDDGLGEPLGSEASSPFVENEQEKLDALLHSDLEVDLQPHIADDLEEFATQRQQTPPYVSFLDKETEKLPTLAGRERLGATIQQEASFEPQEPLEAHPDLPTLLDPPRRPKPSHDIRLVSSEPVQREPAEDAPRQPVLKIALVGSLCLLLLWSFGWFVGAPLEHVIKQHVQMKVSTEPAGATIFLNGKKTGLVTPATLKLQPGTVELRLERRGFQPRVRTLAVKRGHNLVLLFSLRPLATGTLRVIAPLGAVLWLDGVAKGKSISGTLSLVAGPHQVMIKRGSNVLYQSKIKILPGQKHIVRVE